MADPKDQFFVDDKSAAKAAPGEKDPFFVSEAPAGKTSAEQTHFEKERQGTIEAEKFNPLPAWTGLGTDIPHAGFGETIKHAASQGMQGLKELAAPATKTPWSMKNLVWDPADREAQLAQTAPTALESVGHSVAEALPIAGPWVAGLAEQAGTGDIEGAGARGGAQVGAFKAGRAIAGVAPDAIKSKIGEMARTPSGNLKPGVQAGARVATALAGNAILPGVGGTLVGEHVGPALADAILPRHPNPVGQFSKVPNRMPKIAAPTVEAAPKLPKGQITLTGETTGAPGASGRPAPGVAAPVQAQIEAPAPSAPRVAAAGPAVLKVPVPHGEESPLVGSVPRPQLKGMAQRGIEGAGQQLQKLGKPLLYVPESYPGPRVAAPEPEISAPQGGHAGGGVASVEELSRPGRFVKISRSGMASDQGKTPDFNLRPGEAGYQVKPDGTWELKAGMETPGTKSGVQNYAHEVFGRKMKAIGER